jgi:hypothetical protein
MIGYFPQPYSDELWYSICSRFSEQMRFGTETGVMLALYGRRHAIATVDLPHNLRAVSSQLPPGHPCTVDNIIDHHTFLPYYGPFLTNSSYKTVRQLMEDGTKPSVRVRCGACTNRVRPPKYFRSCPDCDRENRGLHGERYWRRLFQLPGVEVCAKHDSFLEPSDIRLDPLPNRHKYFSANSTRLVSLPHPVNRKDPVQIILVDLAKDIEWLLRQERLNPGLEALHVRYGQVLAERSFATKARSLRMAEIRREVLSRYGHKLLQLLQSDLPDNKGDGWLGQLLRKPNTAVAPLRHLLLLRALGISLEQFFFPKISTRPLNTIHPGIGSWPCLNPICDQRGELAINEVQLEPPDQNGKTHIIVTCQHCGFSYRAQDTAERPTKASRIINYGSRWIELLRQQWTATHVTLRQMAKVLGVDPKTVKQRAYELGLKFPRKGKRPVTKRGLYVAANRDKTKAIESHRREWNRLVEKNPESGTKQLRLSAPALYAWLYRNDRLWLAQHKPAKRRPITARPHVDWAKRDEELAGQIATVAAHIKNHPGKLNQVTVTAIGRALGKQSLFEAALKKLPLTRSVIESVLESREDFAVRRVYAAAKKLRAIEGTFPRWKLVRASGLHYRLERQPKVKAALDYEIRPVVNVIVLRDRDAVPQELRRRSTRIPRRLRPFAIVKAAA